MQECLRIAHWLVTVEVAACTYLRHSGLASVQQEHDEALVPDQVAIDGVYQVLDGLNWFPHGQQDVGAEEHRELVFLRCCLDQ